MSTPVSRRSALAGVAAVALTASVPALASTDNDATLIAAWRKWAEVEDHWNDNFITFMWAEHRGERGVSFCMTDEVEDQLNRLGDTILNAKATTAAGHLCKLDFGLFFCPDTFDPSQRWDAKPEDRDYQWRILLSLLSDLEQASGLKATTPARALKRQLASREIEAREKPQREWAAGWISNAERCGQPLGVIHYVDGRALWMDEPASPEKGDPAFNLGRLSKSEMRAVMDVLEEQGKVEVANTCKPSRVTRPVSEAERELVEIFRRAEQRKTMGA